MMRWIRGNLPITSALSKYWPGSTSGIVKVKCPQLSFSTSVAQYSGLLLGSPISEILNHDADDPTAVVASSTLAM